jgi:uracil-DNA glycosylase family 4
MRVKGEGNPHARVFVCGEGPGVVESKTGRPFVETAPAGAELTRYLNGITLPLREDLWITNLVKEWPGGSLTKVKDVTQADIERDEWELHIELQEVYPEIVVCLGRHAARWMLGQDVEMEAIHGLLFHVLYCHACGRRQLGALPLIHHEETCVIGDLVPCYAIAIYHPAAGLHQPEMAARTAYGFAQLSAILKMTEAERMARCWTPKSSGVYTLAEGNAVCPDLPVL